MGGFAGLAALNLLVDQSLDVLTMLGFVILIGTVVNNPILIVHRAAENYRELAMSATEAVNEAVESRLRPIAMSAITTIPMRNAPQNAGTAHQIAINRLVRISSVDRIAM